MLALLQTVQVGRSTGLLAAPCFAAAHVCGRVRAAADAEAVVRSAGGLEALLHCVASTAADEVIAALITLCVWARSGETGRSLTEWPCVLRRVLLRVSV